MPDAVAVAVEQRDRAGWLGAGTILLLGRQAGAALFMAAVLLLPRLTTRGRVDTLVWCYFAVLLVSSVLDLGFERVTAIVVGAEHATGPRSGTSVPSLVRARLATLPLTAAAVWGVLLVAGARASVATVLATAAWAAAIQVQGVVFAVLRAQQHKTFEAVAALTGKAIQAAALVILVMTHQGVATVVLVVAVVDIAIAFHAHRAVIDRTLAPHDWRSKAGWHDVGMFTLVELVAFAYLRGDALIVARLLGAGSGATYSLIYRIVDAVTGVSTPFLLVLFPAAAGMLATGQSLRSLRSSALRFAPVAGAGIAAMAMLASVPVLHLVPRLAEGRGALYLLLATAPLVFFSAFELHLRSAEGANRQIVAIGVAVLAVNIVSNLVLVPRLGLVGAAVALVVAEVFQVACLIATGYRRTPELVSVLPLLAGCLVVLVMLGQVMA